jgi:hypothetical protein
MPIGWAVAIVVLWLAVVALAVVLLGALRQVTSHLASLAEQPPTPVRAQGPAVGSRLPDLTGYDGHAQLGGRPSVLLFLSPACGPCRTLAEEISGSDPSDLARFLTVVTDSGGVDALGLPAWLRVLTVPEDAQAQKFAIPGRPFAIAADEDGFIRGSQLLNKVGHVTDFAAAKLSPELASVTNP